MRISDWSSDVCSSDLIAAMEAAPADLFREALKLHEGFPIAERGPVERFVMPPPLAVVAQRLLASHGSFEGKTIVVPQTSTGISAAALPKAASIVTYVTDKDARGRDRKSTRLNPVTNAHLVCRLLLEKKK